LDASPGPEIGYPDNPVNTGALMHARSLVRLVAISLATAILSTPLISTAETKSGDAYRQEVDAWFKDRNEGLKIGTGWLSLVGLYSLEEGTNSFGSYADNKLVFPDKAPLQAGVFILEDGEIKLGVEPGVQIQLEGEVVSGVKVIPDTQEGTTVFTLDTFTFYVIEREGHFYVRLKDSNAKTIKNFDGIDRYPVDELWRIEARFETYDPPKTIRVPNVVGYDVIAQCTGALVFQIDGQEHRLEPMSSSGESMFVVFGDDTNARETYGGGRFVYVDVPDENGMVVLDFNYAYNPPCVFTPYATCALPHPDNVLSVPVHAGEKGYADQNGRPGEDH